LETTAGIFLFEKARSKCTADTLDALYAWHQQDLAVHVFNSPDRYCNKIGDGEEVEISYRLPDSGYREEQWLSLPGPG
jgi:hypothetical protein